MNKMNIYNNIINKTPFCFIRINDGEASIIMSTDAVASRGDEKYNKILSEKLYNIITDIWTSDDLYIGIPCVNCYNSHYNYVKSELSKSKSDLFIINNIVDANILINSNYNYTLDILINNLYDRNVLFVLNENTIKNIDYLVSILNIKTYITYIVSSKFAFQNDYDKLNLLDINDYTFIITLCGPLGRVLSYEWYKKNNTLSCLDLGSFFDPILQYKSYLYHTNNHKYCNNCYPTSNIKYTNIFNYVESNKVIKECYYLNNLNDTLSLYNNDIYRIILNTNIRIEKEPYNKELKYILTYCNIELFVQNSGHYLYNNIDNYQYLIDICLEKQVFNILDIGFDTAFIVFLENTNGNIININSIDYDYNYLYIKYPNRFKYIKSNNINSINNDIYDIIYINNTNDNITLSTIINCYYKSSQDTTIIINNNTNYIYNICINNNILYPINNNNINILKYNIDHDNYSYSSYNILNSYNYIITIIDNISNINEFNKLSTYIEEKKMLQIINVPNNGEGYAFQIIDQFNDLMNICHTYPVKKILDIGFLYGSSSLMFLINTNAHVTSIDCNECKQAEKYIMNLYPNRFNFIKGYSKDIIPLLKDTYDLIYIDGCHEYNEVKQDLLLVNKHNDTIIIMNDVVLNNKYSMFWNEGPTRLYKEINKIELLAKTYCTGRGMAVFKLHDNIDKDIMLNMSKDEIYNEITFLIDNKIYNQKLIQLTDIYLNYFSMILSNEDYYYIRYYNSYNSINKIEELLNEPNITLTIKNKCLNFIKEYYKYYYDNNIVTIPNIIHLIYINERPLKHYNYQCIYSIIKYMPHYQIYIHNDIEPDTEEWNKLKQHNNIYIKSINRINNFDGYNIKYVQYESDILRMMILYEYGGIYIDTDILLVNNIDKLLSTNNSIYIAKETEDNIINCAIISEKENEFIKIWMDHFSTGFRINIWGWHIRNLPKILLDKYPHYIYKYNIKLLDYKNFCPIHWTEKDKFINGSLNITDDIYGIHLFETILEDLLLHNEIIYL